MSFPSFTEAEIRKGLELCARPFFVSSNSDFARDPGRFSGLFEVLIKSGYDVKTLGDCKEARTLIRNAFLGWHCAHEDDDGLSHTAVALAPRKQPMTGQMIQKHIDSVGGLKLIANAPAAVRKLEKRLVQRVTREEDHPYRFFLTLLFNDGRGTMVRGENPVVLVNPVVVHVHGTYLSSMATECAVRGWVEPSPSFSLIEQIVMQELMAEFKATLGLYAEDLPSTTLRSLQRKKPHKHALWHRLNVEGSSPRPPTCARDILIVQNDAKEGFAIKDFLKHSLARIRALEKPELLKAEVSRLTEELQQHKELLAALTKDASKPQELQPTFEKQLEEVRKAEETETKVLLLDAINNLVIRCMLDMTKPDTESTFMFKAFEVGSSKIPAYFTAFFDVFPTGIKTTASKEEVEAKLKESLNKFEVQYESPELFKMDPITEGNKTVQIAINPNPLYITYATNDLIIPGALLRDLIERKSTESTGMTMSAVKDGLPNPPTVDRYPDGLRQFCETRVKLAANMAAAFQAAAVVFVAQSDGGSKFRDREGRAAARGALQTAVRAMLYDV